MERLEAALAKAREQRKARAGAGIGEFDAAQRIAPAGMDWAGLPSITIPADRAQKNRIAALVAGKDAAPFDMLRSRTYRTMKEKSWTRLAVTSPDASCGKTTVSLNLAISLARQKDLRIMLIDLDLRRPALHKILGQTPKHSFWEVLERKADFADCARVIGGNLVVAMNAAAARNPAELLHSTQTSTVLTEIEQSWRPDITIFDMSPMLASDDNVGFLGNVDCALLIAAAEGTRLSNIDICEKELAQLTNVMGVVLNKCRYTDDSVGYNYGTYY
ncbi:MAG: CpsD/CapB family tyrosine-protein kinase [Pseudomonadota bacterium]